MGTSNPLAWFLPFSGGPDNESGWGPWEENGFEDEGTSWPPIDPDKLPRSPLPDAADRNTNPFIHGRGDKNEDAVQAFKRRQQEDYKRWESIRSNPQARQRLKSESSPSSSWEEIDPSPSSSADYGNDAGDNEDNEYQSDDYEEGMDGHPGWTNSDGDRLRDYGVDEDAELIIEDDIPLGELLRRRRVGHGGAANEVD